MLAALLASVPATIAALAMWRGGSAPLARMEAKLDDLLQWQIDHDREHTELEHIRRRRGGQQ